MLSESNQIADQASEEILAGLEGSEPIYQEIFESTSAKHQIQSLQTLLLALRRLIENDTQLSFRIIRPPISILKNSRSRARHYLSPQRLGCQPVSRYLRPDKHQALTESRYQN